MLGRILPLAVVLVACSGTTSTPAADNVSPGVIIRAQSLVGTYGCGEKPGQVYKYVAEVHSSDDPPPPPIQVAGVFDCYADGLLANLTSNSQNYLYGLTVYAYDKPTYDAHQADLNAALTPPYDFSSIEANKTYTFKTTCSAVLPTAGLTSGAPIVQVLAQCNPLAPAPVADAGTQDAATD